MNLDETLGAAISRRMLAEKSTAGAEPGGDTPETPGDSGAVTLSVNDPMPEEPRTELGYAHRLIHVYGGRLRYVPVWRRWLVWDGKRWAHDTTGQAKRWMKVIARLIYTDALAIVDDGQRKAALNLARRGESSAGISGALTLASTHEAIVISPEDLDADPFVINCANGTLDLRTGQLRAHDQGDLLTKITGAAHDPHAQGTQWQKFLERVQPDQKMREFLARLVGHALEGRVSEHTLPIFCGEGANGKGTFINAIITALGDYADAADPDLLTARSFDAHPTGTADLFGLRLAILHETDAGKRLAEATVKRLTGGDRLKARRMREDFWSFDPSHTFLMLTNHKPLVSGTDEGIWRRIRLVPWPVVIPAAEREEDLGQRLTLETDAILTWIVNGYRDWRDRGLDEPETVTSATNDYRGESDALGRFLDERCLLGPNFKVRSSELFGVWSAWCAREGEVTGTNKAFTEALQGRGYDNHRTNIGAVWRGIGLAADGAE